MARQAILRALPDVPETARIDALTQLGWPPIRAAVT
jgi:hypothetical protein